MRTTIFSLLVTTAVSFPISSRAFAQTAPAPEPTQIPVARATPDPAAAATGTDPNIDRGFLQPTAMTQPAGSLTYNNYELLLHGLTYGITDDLQASLTVLSPIAEEMPFVGFGAVKWRFLRSDRVSLAAQGSVGFGHQFQDSSDPNLYTLGAGALASFCLRQDCSSLLSLTATYQLGWTSNSVGRAQMLIYGGSLVHRVSSHVKLLGEITTAAAWSASSDVENMEGILASYGVRFHTGNIAGDVGFIKPFIADADDELLLGLPFINVSYRWQ